MKQALAKLELLKAEFQDAASLGATPGPGSSDPSKPAPAGIVVPLAPTPQAASSRDADRLIKAGVAVVVGFFGFLGVWAALSPLESAAITYGIVSADGNRKAIQHIDGGIVDAILVKEGDRVEAGQELIRLDQLQPRAALEIQSAVVATQSAVLARLEAESAARASLEFPKLLTDRRTDPAVEQLLLSQTELFKARRKANETQTGTLREQVKQANSQIEIFEGQAQAAADQYRIGPHTDYGTLTILDRQQGMGGLEVLVHGEWEPAPWVDGALTVNTGLCMQRWSNRRWVANEHRVLAPPDADPDEELVSLIYFHDPQHDSVIEPLPGCVDEDHPAQYAPVLAGAHLGALLDAIVVPT